MGSLQGNFAVQFVPGQQVIQQGSITELDIADGAITNSKKRQSRSILTIPFRVELPVVDVALTASGDNDAFHFAYEVPNELQTLILTDICLFMRNKGTSNSTIVALYHNGVPVSGADMVSLASNASQNQVVAKPGGPNGYPVPGGGLVQIKVTSVAAGGLGMCVTLTGKTLHVI